jgi:DNA-binding beta-propeller fold protein YncE
VTSGTRACLLSTVTLLLVGCNPSVGAAPSVAHSSAVAGSGLPVGSARISGLQKPFGIAAEPGSIWATEYDLGNLVRIDPVTSRIVGRSHVGVHAAHVVAHGGFIWVTDDQGGSVISVDEKTGAISRDIPLRQNFDLRPSAIAAGGDSVWVTLAPGFEHGASAQIPPCQLVRIEISRKEVVATIPIRGVAAGVALGGGAVWVASLLEPASIYRIDPTTNRVVATIATGHPLSGALAFKAPDLWVANQDGYLTRIDSRTNQVIGNFEVGSPEWPALVADGQSIWISAPLDNVVARFDPGLGAVTSTTRAGTRPQGFAFLGKDMWVANYVDGTVTKLPIN